MSTVDLGPRKTMFVLVIVVGCFAVLWPKVFYPMMMGTANQQMKPGPIDKTTGCCTVLSDVDVNTIKILTELCNRIVGEYSTSIPLKECQKIIQEKCNIDVAFVLQQNIKLGANFQELLNQVRSFNGSNCLKYQFGLDPAVIGVPHRVTLKINDTSLRQERPAHLRPEMLHPALRERGRAIPPTATRTVVEGRPGPIPGMRPTMGGPGHIVPPSTKGTSTMSIVMPIYTIGIVIFFTYTLVKLLFKKQQDASTLYPPVEPERTFRKHVFEQPPKCAKPLNNTAPMSNGDTIKQPGPAKLGDIELDQLRQRLRETELAMERIVAQMAAVPLRSQEGRSIFLEGKLPAQSQLLVTDAATEVTTADSVTSGKMTLSVIPTTTNATATADENEETSNKKENGIDGASSTDEEMEKQEIEEVSDILT